MSTKDIIDAVRKDNRVNLTEIESKLLLSKAGIPVTETKLATSKEEATKIANNLGYPVVLKISSSEILHKSDIGGVKLGLETETSVLEAYEEIISNARIHEPNAKIDGISVQSNVKTGVEIIIGSSKDAQFGPFVMFGLGGVFVEVLKDVAFRIVPLDPRDAKEMIREIKGYPLLEGYRGGAPCDISAIEESIIKLSNFLNENEDIKELDLNPIFVYEKGLIAVDARVILENSIN
jgi:acyl-CoA synthetase (NDP forming)